MADLCSVPLVARTWKTVVDRYGDAPSDRLARELVRDQIGTMVNDVLEETRRRIADSSVKTVADIRSAKGALAGFSEALAAEERDLKAFLWRRMYDAPPVRAVKTKAQQVVAGLFSAYRDDPGLLPPPWRPADPDPVQSLRAIGDFIAGMTDRYAIGRYEELVGPADMPEGF